MASHQVPNFDIVVQDLAPRVEQVWQRINYIAPDILSSNIYVKAYARDCLNQLHVKSAMTPSLVYQLACLILKKDMNGLIDFRIFLDTDFDPHAPAFNYLDYCNLLD